MTKVRGQAAVETALTLPLLLFMVLGTLQLFTLLQGRILAQYAVSRATRMGSINHAKCDPMIQSAITILMPAIDPSFATAAPGATGAKFASEVRLRVGNKYQVGNDGNRDGPVVWIDRVRPLAIPAGSAQLEEDIWNLPESPDRTLEVRMTFWFPLKIPFANWAFARLAMAHWGVEQYHGVSPYMMATRDANWVQDATAVPATKITNEMRTRFGRQQYVFPIQASYAMRMMSPPRFDTQNCQ